MVKLTVVPVIPLALSEAMKTATLAISASVMSRRACVLLASKSCHCSQVIPDALARGALKRARASLQRRRPPIAEHGLPPAPESPSEDAIVAKFVRAYEFADLDALVALLTDNVFSSMPPIPLEYQGCDAVARLCASIFRSGRRFDLVPTRANGQPAFGAYLRSPGGIRQGTGLLVLTLTADRICGITRFDNSVLPWFGLPRSLPSR